MKRRIHIRAALLLILVMLASVVSAGAVSQSRNGLTVEVSTNKEVYAADEQIRGTVKVHNANNYELAVAYELVLPEQLEATAKDKGVLLLEADEVTSGGFTVQMAQRGADVLPATGDQFPMELIGILLAVSLVMMIVLCPKKQTMSFLLVLMLLAQMGAPALISIAAAEAVYPEDAWQQVFEDEKTEEEMELIWDKAELEKLDRAAMEDPDEDAVLDTFVLEQRVVIDDQLMTIYVKVTVSSGESLAGLKNTLGNVSLKSITILGQTKFKLTWSKVPGATHYEVWHRGGSTGNYIKRATTTATTWTTNYGKAGVINTYKVRAITKDGNAVTAKGPYATRTAYGMAMPTVTSVEYVSSTSKQVRIVWRAGSFCTGYNVYRSLTGETGTYVRIGSSSGTSFVDKYHNGYYKIRPYYNGNNGICYVGPATPIASMENPFDIVAQPVDVTVAEGQVASVSVKAIGKGLKYQWYYADVGEETFHKSKIAKNTYSMKMTEVYAGRRVYCAVTDITGRKRTTSTVGLNMLVPFSYVIEDNRCTVTGYQGSDAAIIVPAYIEGAPVIAIAENAFANNTSMTGLELPESVAMIGASAFKGCTALTAITLPGGMTVVEESTFEGCTSLTSVTLPNGITTIGKRAFYGCTSLSDMETYN